MNVSIKYTPNIFATCGPENVIVLKQSESNTEIGALCSPIYNVDPMRGVRFNAIVTCCDENTGVCIPKSVSGICH